MPRLDHKPVPGIDTVYSLPLGELAEEPERDCPIPNRGIRREILASAFEFESTDADYFVDDEEHYAQGAINALTAGEVFDICTSLGPLPFEPDRPATRAELIDAIAKALDLIPVISCRIMV